MHIGVLQRLSMIGNQALALVLLLLLQSLILHKDQLSRLLGRHEVIVLLEILITSHVPIWTILILSLIGCKSHSL